MVTIQKTVGSGAVEVDDGLALLRFDGIREVAHPDWAETAEQNKYHKADSGDRLDFDFTLLDDEGAVSYSDDGDPKVIVTTTTVYTGEKSKAYLLLKGIFTKEEQAQFDAGSTDFDIEGRVVQGIVAHNKGGYPFIESTMPATKAQIKLATAAAA